MGSSTAWPPLATWRSHVKTYRVAVIAAVGVVLVLVGGSSTRVQWQPLEIDGSQRNLQLLQRKMVQPLKNGEALRLGITGGSISTLRGGYGEQTLQWLNRNCPPEGGQNHTLINVAIGGSESGVASLCLNTMFDVVEAGPIPIDLLLIEYGYNDIGLPLSTPGNAQTNMKLDAVSNYERIVRSALSWPIPVIVMETAAYAGNLRTQEAKNLFTLSTGAEHAKVARHYGVPIVNFAGFLNSFADATVLPQLFSDHGIHPTMLGHSLMATLLVQELMFHFSMSDRMLAQHQTSYFSGAIGPSWPHFLGRVFHGLDFDEYQKEYVTLVASEQLAPLPRSIWNSAETEHAWACRSSQIPRTETALHQAAVVQKGFSWMVDLTDGGETRSRNRPGYTTNATNSHLVYELEPNSQRVALLFRKSWMPSGSALVWVDQSPDVLEEDHLKCPGTPKVISGWWTSRTTQGTLEEICPGEMNWDENSGLYLHILSRPELPGNEHSNGMAAYFKSYGFATSV